MIFLDNPQSFEKYIKSNKNHYWSDILSIWRTGFDFDVSDYPEQAKKKNKINIYTI